jgi:hypothetical protein
MLLSGCSRAGLFLLLWALPVWGDSPYAVEEQAPLSLRALIDVRFVRQGPAPSWMEDGPGKTRYGGVVEPDGSFERITRFAAAQLALEPAAALPGDIRATAQLNWNVDVAFNGEIGNSNTWPLLIEATLRREWETEHGGWALQGGVTNAPLSLEHTGPAHTPRFSLTPSALNSWLWEEGRVVGAEAEWWTQPESAIGLGIMGGLGWGPDQMGILVARRGWVLSDFLSGVNSALPIPGSGRDTHVFDEIDDRPALYAVVNAEDPWRIGRLRLGYYDNLGNLADQGVWETRFGMVGGSLQPLPGLDIVIQYLIGHTATRANSFESTISAWFPLVSYRFREHRFTARYDQFRVDDLDGPPDTGERGAAVTLAYLFEFWLRHRLAFEYITFTTCERPLPGGPCNGGWQLSYRFRY